MLAAALSYGDADIQRAKAAELSLHRTERLVTLAKIPDAFLWKIKRLELVPLPHAAVTEAAFRVTQIQQAASDGSAIKIDLTLDGNGKAIKHEVGPGTEAANVTTWPDKDPLTLCENSLHYVLDNAVVKPELKPYFEELESLVLNAGKDAEGKLIAVIDMRAKDTKPILRVWIKTDGNFAAAQFVTQE